MSFWPQVRDCVFLPGYTEPVLLLLHETDPTWAGRLRWGYHGRGGGFKGEGAQVASMSSTPSPTPRNSVESLNLKSSPNFPLSDGSATSESPP